MLFVTNPGVDVTGWTNQAQAAAAKGATGTIASGVKNFKTIQV